MSYFWDLGGLPRRPVVVVERTETLPLLGVLVSLATRAERKIAAAAREAIPVRAETITALREFGSGDWGLWLAAGRMG